MLPRIVLGDIEENKNKINSSEYLGLDVLNGISPICHAYN